MYLPLEISNFYSKSFLEYTRIWKKSLHYDVRVCSIMYISGQISFILLKKFTTCKMLRQLLLFRKIDFFHPQKHKILQKTGYFWYRTVAWPKLKTVCHFFYMYTAVIIISQWRLSLKKVERRKNVIKKKKKKI